MQPPQGIEGSRTLVTMIRTWCLAVGPQSLKLPNEIESPQPPYERGAGTSHRSKKIRGKDDVVVEVQRERKGIEPFSPVPKTGILPSCHWTNAPRGSSQAKSNHSILHTREEPVPAMRAKKSTERIELSFTVPKTVVLIHYTTRTEPHRLLS